MSHDSHPVRAHHLRYSPRPPCRWINIKSAVFSYICYHLTQALDNVIVADHTGGDKTRDTTTGGI